MCDIMFTNTKGYSLKDYEWLVSFDFYRRFIYEHGPLNVELNLPNFPIVIIRTKEVIFVDLNIMIRWCYTKNNVRPLVVEL